MEKHIEAHLVKRVKALGGIAYKWRGHGGAADRIVVLPGGVVWFVEVKTIGGRLSPLQKLFAADMARLRGAARAGYSRGFAQHIDRLCGALRLSDDASVNRVRVTHLMSSLVGALLFARAVDDPAQSDAILHSMRRCLRVEFGGDAAVATRVRTNGRVAAHDFFHAV